MVRGSRGNRLQPHVFFVFLHAYSVLPFSAAHWAQSLPCTSYLGNTKEPSFPKTSTTCLSEFWESFTEGSATWWREAPAPWRAVGQHTTPLVPAAAFWTLGGSTELPKPPAEAKLKPEQFPLKKATHRTMQNGSSNSGTWLISVSHPIADTSDSCNRGDVLSFAVSPGCYFESSWD